MLEVLPEREPVAGRPLTAADEADRIDLEQQRRGRPPFADLRVEHVRGAHGQAERLQPPGMLVQQESQVGCGFSGRRDRQQHNAPLCQTRRPLSPDFSPGARRAPPGDGSAATLGDLVLWTESY